VERDGCRCFGHAVTVVPALTVSPINLHVIYIFESTTTGDRAVRGREKPDPGFGSDATRSAPQKRALWDLAHDYKGNGTTSLFAALDLQGKVNGQCYQRDRHQEFLRFLRTLNQEFPGEVPLHLIIDDYGTHKHPNVKAWLKRHPRFVLHCAHQCQLVEATRGALVRPPG
jgi:hypothetical protein